ncbi:MAG: 4-phosphopantetheinyl transferase family protein [Flavobacterium sp.]|nr:MAG: 4-phosphopantetheinyl transferase family protein [Flavobacterium sp.]
MIGNDVVDLAQTRIDSKWQRSGFIDKLFTDAEQKLIKSHHDSEIMIWLLWSMKEAAYKIYNQQTKIREYAPKKISCSINIVNSNNAEGYVEYDKNKYYTKTIITPEYIHTVAVKAPGDFYNIIEIEKKGIVKDENGIPYIKSSNLNKKNNVSVSHHGRFEHVVAIV